MVRNGKAKTSTKTLSEDGDKSADSEGLPVKSLSVKVDRISNKSKSKKRQKESGSAPKGTRRTRAHDVVTISDSEKDESSDEADDVPDEVKSKNKSKSKDRKQETDDDDDADRTDEDDVDSDSSTREKRKKKVKAVNGGHEKAEKSSSSNSKNKTKSSHKSRSDDAQSDDGDSDADSNMVKEKLHDNESEKGDVKSDGDSAEAGPSRRKKGKVKKNKSRSSSRHSSVANSECSREGVNSDDVHDPKLEKKGKVQKNKSRSSSRHSSIANSERSKEEGANLDDPKLEAVPQILLTRLDNETISKYRRKNSENSIIELSNDSLPHSEDPSEDSDAEVSPDIKNTRSSRKDGPEKTSNDIIVKSGRMKMTKASRKRSPVKSDSEDEEEESSRRLPGRSTKTKRERSSDESDEEADTRRSKRSGKSKISKKKKAKKYSEDGDSESEDERPSRSKKGSSRKGRYRESSSSDSDDRSKRRRKSRRKSSDSESSEDRGRKKRREKRTAKKKKRRSSTSESESSDSSTDRKKKKSRRTTRSSKKDSGKKKKKKKKKESTSESSEREIFASSDDLISSDEEAKAKKNKKKAASPSKGKNKAQKNDDSSEEEIIAPSKRMRKDESESESEVSVTKATTKKSSRIKVIEKESDDEEPVTRRKRLIRESSDEVEDTKMPSKKRKVDFVSDEEKGDKSGDDDSDESGSGDSEDEDETKGRKNIRKIMKQKTVSKMTKRAELKEKLRKERIAARQKHYNEWIIQETGVNDVPITKQMILERDEETEEIIVEVSKHLVQNLKPHQVDAVQFMWNCLIESVERYKKDVEPSGCLLAHCMGLGKTLSVITLTHTLLKSEVFDLTRLLVVCPLNTVLNWRNEWKMWITKKDGLLDLYDITSGSCDVAERIKIIRRWHRHGGVLILGYDMYRNLALGNRVRSKNVKKELEKYLLDPGPDIVVCDEGHLMKNPESSLSKVVNRIKTRRRIVLTGTPLQNNLKEYYTMVSFVKPSLLGTKNEFANRFVNPIMNGQHSNSTQYDVKLMKKRSHILYKTLDGCVHRRDYSALTKYLPPKYEYIIYVRLSECQRNLYSQYLHHIGADTDFETSSSLHHSKALFNNQQVLYRVWTHPYSLKMYEDRRALTMHNFLDDEDDDFIDDDESESKSETSESSNDAPSKRRKKASNASSDKSDAESDDDDDDDEFRGRKEVVRKWGTKSRGGVPRNLGISDDEGKEGTSTQARPPPSPINTEWWHADYKEEYQDQIEMGGKLTTLMHLLRMCSDIGDKTIVFSQSLISLDLIEHFLGKVDEQNENRDEKTEEEKKFGFTFLNENDLVVEKDDEGKEKEGETKNGSVKASSNVDSTSNAGDSKMEEEKDSESKESSKDSQSNESIKKPENCDGSDDEKSKKDSETPMDTKTTENGENDSEEKGTGEDKTELAASPSGNVVEKMDTDEKEERKSDDEEPKSKDDNEKNEEESNAKEKEESGEISENGTESAETAKSSNEDTDAKNVVKGNEADVASQVITSDIADLPVSQMPMESAAAKVCGLQGFESQLGFNSWVKGLDYHRLDGSTSVQMRKQMAESFNDVLDNRMRLFLISTKAGGLGINLVAANRVIIFDVSWNPSHDIQSIFRTYRFGQTKPVYVYRLIAQGTMEEKIYNRQVTKQSLSSRVIDEMQIERHYTESDLADLYNFTPDVYDPENPPSEKPALPRDRLLADLIDDFPQLIQKYHMHDSLLENKGDEDLTEEELKEAWQEFEMEKKRGIRIHPGRPPVANYLSEAELAERQTLHFAQALCQMYPALYGQMRDRVCQVRPHLTQQPINLCRMTNSYVLSVLKMNPVQFAHEYGKWMQEQQQQRFIQQLLAQQRQVAQQLQQQHQLPPALVQQLQQQQMLLQQQHHDLLEDQQQTTSQEQSSSQAQQSRLPTLNNPIIIDGDE